MFPGHVQTYQDNAIPGTWFCLGPGGSDTFLAKFITPPKFEFIVANTYSLNRHTPGAKLQA